MKMNKLRIIVFGLIVALMIAGCSNSESTKDGEDVEKENESGGELRVAIASSPTTLDPVLTTVTLTRDISKQVFETLVTVNERYEPVPMLADTIDESEDGKTYTFNLRKGVKFHNGQEMTAEDVVASMDRWLEYSTSAKAILGEATFQEVDNYTVNLILQKPTFLALTALSATIQSAAIMPKDVVEAAAPTGVEEIIGTGPFKFSEWKDNQYIHLTKNDDYQSLETPSDGMSGAKEALVDDIYYDIVTDLATRLAGVQTGQYDIGDTMSQDDYDQMKNDSRLIINESHNFTTTLVYNKKDGWFANQKMRQAVNAGLDIDSLAKASLVNNYRMNSSYMMEEIVNWFSEGGKDLYNEYDVEKAKKLLKEANYNGEEITIITTRDYPFMYNGSIVIKDQLSKIGINVKIEIYDSPTVLSLREDPSKWDLYVVGFPPVKTPLELVFFTEGFYDGPEDEKITGLLSEIKESPSLEEAFGIWEELQAYSWEFVPVTKIADASNIIVTSAKVEGYSFLDGPILWNTKKTK